MFRVEVRPDWTWLPGDPGGDWAPVFDDPADCEFETRAPARALLLVCMFAVKRLGFHADRELRIREFCGDSNG